MNASIVERLSDADAELRRRAVVELASSELEDRAARLVVALGDVDWRVRKEAARVATENAEPWSLLPALVDALAQGDNVGLRNSALEVLEALGPRAAPSLLDALPRVPETARKFVVAALGFAGAEALGPLATLAHDPEPNTAQAALEALARVGGPQAVDVLRGHLRASDPVQRLAALEGLEHLEARLSLEELAPLIEDRWVRRLAVRMLGLSDDPRASAVLFRVLEDGSPALALEAVAALGRLLDRGGADAVLAHASIASDRARRALRAITTGTSHDRERRAAITLLVWAHDAEALPAAAELAAEDALSPVAIEALRRWGAAAVDPLLASAPSLAPRARAAALEMAAELAEPEGDARRREAVAVALRGALGSDDAVVAAAAAGALFAYAEPSDAEALVRCALRFPEHAARAVGRALERLVAHSKEAVEHAIRAVPIDGAVSAALLPAVAALGGTAANDRLQATLNAGDPRARRAAVMALPRLGGVHAVELAGFALADEDLDVQVAAVQVLAQLFDDEGRPLGAEPLRLALRSGVEPVVAAAARALGAIGDRASVLVLREHVAHGRPGVAVAAMESLRSLHDPELDGVLDGALDQRDEELAKEALRAIAESASVSRSARIARALEHEAWDVRQLAARLLAELGDPSACAALAARLEHEPDAGVRESLEDAIARLGGGP